MSVLFRTDASLEIGTGHVMRCLALADALRAEGLSSRFVCREHPGHLGDLIAARGHAVSLLPLQAPPGADASAPYLHWVGAEWTVDAAQTLQAAGGKVDWIVADHYGLDLRWEAAVRPHCKALMVIDDLRNREHGCDLLLDQGLGCTPADYRGLVPPACKVLAGVSFAMLRPEFAQLRSYSLDRRRGTGIRQLLLALGGVDRDNVTGQVLHALRSCPLPGDTRIVVVLGPHAPWVDAVRAAAATLPWAAEVRQAVTEMARLMADSDLAIGAAGSTAWERCSLGLPALACVLAENQRAGAQALAEAGAVRLLRMPAEDQDELAQALRELRDPATLARMQAACAAVTDGKGLDRVIAAMIEHEPL